MKILYPIEGDGGGAITHVLTLASQLEKWKIETFIVFISSGPSVDTALNQGLNFKVLPCRFFPDFTLIRRFANIIEKEKVDIVHTHTIRGNFYGRMAALLSRRPTVSMTTVHSFLIDELGGSAHIGLKQRMLYHRETLTRRFVDHFVSVSRTLGDKLLQEEVKQDRLSVICHGIPIPANSDNNFHGSRLRSEFGIKKKETVIGIVGRLVSVKNHALFLLAAERVLRFIPEVKFLIIGDGALRADLEKLTSDLNISESVIFTGWRNDIEECMKAIDVLVLCSTTESQGLVILEAMSFALPVIATDVNQVRETVINGRTGLLIPSNDDEALAEAMLKLLKNDNLAKRLGAQGRALVEDKYSLEKMIHETANLYKMMDERKRLSPNGR
ncbi:MAG: glycosyltransferase family 4 protein [Desulfobacteraceae bacterium]|nr:glycosyltransferase family 4 protein [Desulfobacteraceae bacterium]MBC2718647.1 glycosyltransferase family 4 protein [Desulfobacteraceae bacterium]